jgi:hypothetical protein
VPLPRFASWDDFNDWLEEQCRKRHADILRGHTETIGQRLQRDLKAMAELPPGPFDACEVVAAGLRAQHPFQCIFGASCCSPNSPTMAPARSPTASGRRVSR